MEFFRITKYNHKKFGTSEYLNDWTSVFDVGKNFNNKVLTPKLYIETENKYIYLLNEFIEKNSVSEFTICDLEFKDCENTLKSINSRGVPPVEKEKLLISELLRNKRIADIENIGRLARLALREVIWCKLENPRMFVHFGYDFYMYIGCEKKISNARFIDGMYIEAFKSPYL